jgi:hypothetical protein
MQEHLGCMMLMCGSKGERTSLALQQMMYIWVVFGQGRGTWLHTQELDPPALGNTGALERSVGPIDTPMTIIVGRFTGTHKERAHPRECGESA